MPSSTGSTTLPKTRLEVVEEQLRELESSLGVCKALLACNVTAEGTVGALREAEAKVAGCKGYTTFVQVGSVRVIGSDSLEALLEEEEHLDNLVKLRVALQGRDPHAEAIRLLRRKGALTRERLGLLE